ncbi:unnamed protein product, partial [Rotaria sp. Silwood2]
ISRTQTNYLEYNIKNGEIRPSPLNINGFLNTRLSQAADEACKFVKAAEYYRKFIPNFSQIVEPLRKLVPTTRTQQNKWQTTIVTLTNEEIKAFEQLKKFLATDFVLRLPNNRFPFKVCALDRWHKYLSEIKFIRKTDHKALTQLNQKVQINKRHERWRLKVSDYDFNVKYIPGLTDSMPDYSSSSPVDDAEEDPNEVSFVISKSIQTAFLDVKNHSSIVAAVQTRAMKLRNQTLNDTTDIQKLTSDSLIPRSSNLSSNTSITKNRIIPFRIGELIQTQIK